MLKKVMCLNLILLFIGMGVAFAGTISLPKTGQTKCYDSSGAEISCSGTCQDGDIQAGVAWPNPRFTDNGNGTVTDNLDGLMWTKDANLPKQWKEWQDTLDYVAGMNSGTGTYGYSDWRLPNRKELYSLMKFTDQLSWPFTYVQLPDYWSSTTFVADVYWGGTDFVWIA